MYVWVYVCEGGDGACVSVFLSLSGRESLVVGERGGGKGERLVGTIGRTQHGGVLLYLRVEVGEDCEGRSVVGRLCCTVDESRVRSWGSEGK